MLSAQRGKKLINQELRRHRATLYLSEERVKTEYIAAGGIDRLDELKNLEKSVQAGPPGYTAVLVGKLSRSSAKTKQTQISDHPELMGSRSLLDRLRLL